MIFIINREKKNASVSFLWLLTIQIFLIGAFLMHAKGRWIVSDDHPSFLYRIALLKDHLLSIPFYNTAWNAGYVAREFFPTGTLNVFFFALPFLYFFQKVDTFYVFLPIFLGILIPSFGTYLAVRILYPQKNYSQAVLAGILATGTSLTYYEWFLSYGTLGFIVSIGLFPLAVAMILRFFSDPFGISPIFCLQYLP